MGWLTVKRNNHSSLSFVVSMTLFTMFALFMMLVLLMGASSFRSVAERAEQRYNERTPLLYVSQRLRAGNAAAIAEIDGIQTLRLTESFSNGELSVYVYLYNGYICELTALADTTPDLSLGIRVIPAESLLFEAVTPALVRTEVNGNSIYVNLPREVRTP
jgi:hypothetical protein